MATVTAEQNVDAPARDVFELVTNLDRCAAIINGIEKIDVLTPGPFGRGTRWRETRKFGGREATEEMTVTFFDPPRRYIVNAESHGARYRTEVSVEATGASSCCVTQTFEATPVSLLAKLMSPLSFLMAGMVRKCFEADLADIAKAAEATPASQGTGRSA